MYGTEGADGSFAANCLPAAIAERGALHPCYHRDWDHHGNMKRHPVVAKEVDQAAAFD